MTFSGYGYHDKTWVDPPLQEAIQAAFWGPRAPGTLRRRLAALARAGWHRDQL
ncbi:hypothetical protein CCHR01_12122 [Colletotrichum chrysophilum]|uniref:Uncharacterized protein n=1 Tax=Colletotrichum chrysophilum TaxID=1836956 RepID=A0AAD9EF03_9PEZI|nr:hypothetical protein CCHR01_12122 [Colletotrichum chrysophilum]